MFKLSEAHPYLLFLFNIIVILAVSWFASWTYLYSFSGLWRHLSAADFRNVLCISMLISTLMIIDGAAILERSGFFRRRYEHTALAEKGMPSANTRRSKH